MYGRGDLPPFANVALVMAWIAESHHDKGADLTPESLMARSGGSPASHVQWSRARTGPRNPAPPHGRRRCERTTRVSTSATYAQDVGGAQSPTSILGSWCPGSECDGGRPHARPVRSAPPPPPALQRGQPRRRPCGPRPPPPPRSTAVGGGRATTPTAPPLRAPAGAAAAKTAAPSADAHQEAPTPGARSNEPTPTAPATSRGTHVRRRAGAARGGGRPSGGADHCRPAAACLGRPLTPLQRACARGAPGCGARRQVTPRSRRNGPPAFVTQMPTGRQCRCRAPSHA